MSGKNKCKMLKEIRQKIADANDIPYITNECRYKGNCKGTCPKCEEELAYLERELLKRKKLGKRIALAGLATATVLVGLKGCSVVKEKVNELIDSNSTQGALEAVYDIDLNDNN